MSRASNDNFYLRIEDELSGLTILEAELDVDGIADLMSTRTARHQDAQYYHNEGIGKKMEHKSVKIKADNLREKMNQIADEAEQQNPGWISDRSSYNSNCYDHKDGTYQLTMRRYV